MDFGREVLEGSRDMDTRLKGDPEKREEHLFSDGQSGDIGWSDGRETHCWER